MRCTAKIAPTLLYSYFHSLYPYIPSLSALLHLPKSGKNASGNQDVLTQSVIAMQRYDGGAGACSPFSDYYSAGNACNFNFLLNFEVHGHLFNVPCSDISYEWNDDQRSSLSLAHLGEGSQRVDFSKFSP